MKRKNVIDIRSGRSRIRSWAGPRAMVGWTLIGVFLLAGVASAQSAPSDPSRRFGFGTAFGAGYTSSITSVAGIRTTDRERSGMLPSLELRFFLRQGHSIDVSVPLTDILLVATSGRFLWRPDVVYNLNIGKGKARFLIASGLGFGVLGAPGVGGLSVRIPALIGVEILTPKRRFGFQVRARPALEIGFAASESRSARYVTGSALLELAFIGYSRR